jgi:hypothetical protein
MPRPKATPSGPSAGPAPDFWTRRATALAFLLLGALLLQGLAFIGESSQTSDEAAHLAAGYSYLKTGDFRLNVEHPPLIKELAAAPLLALDLAFPWGPLWEHAEEWNIGRIFVHENRLPDDTILLVARLPMLLLSLLLAAAIYRRGLLLFGPRGALLALALYVFDPNVVAHSCLVTTDLGVSLFIFLSIDALWRWAERPRPRTLWLAGLAVGGAFASKFTALWLLPMLAILGVLLVGARVDLPRRPWSARTPVVPAGAPRRTRALALLGAAAVLAVAAVAVVATTYGFAGLPAFARGLTIGLQHSGRGHIAYLMGSISESGWWYYFLLAYLVKTPPGTLLAVVGALALFALGRRLRPRDELALWVPVLVTIAITCVWRVNIGLRHLLPIYPFLSLAAGRLAAAPSAPAAGADAAPPPPGRFRRAWIPGALAIVCAAWSAIEATRILPYDLAYFNLLAGGPDGGHRVLLDSNLDWGQSSRALRGYMTRERLPAIYCAYAGNSDPWYYGVVYQYLPGSGNLMNAKTRPTRVPADVRREIVAVSPMVLHSVHFTEHDLYDWLLPRRPIARPGHTWFVYDITGDADVHARLAAACLNFGLPELADDLARRTLALEPGNALAKAVLDKLSEPGGKAVKPLPPEPL